MSEQQEGRPKGIFFGWYVVGASMVCMSTGPGPFAFAALGIFMLPFTQEFGWDRAEISFCSFVLVASTAITIPFIGRIVDRLGARFVLMPSLVFMAVCLAAIPLWVSELWHLMLIFLFIGTLAAGTNSVPYMPVLSAWFYKKRGLAIGLTLSGVGFGYFYMPLIVQYLIDNSGWRSGYFALSSIVVFIALPLAFIFVRESPAEMGLKPDGIEQGEPPKATKRDVGYTSSEVLRRREFWMLSLVFVTLTFVLNGMLAHLVPMLSDRGMDTSHAAWIAALEGLVLMISRPLIGVLLDRFFAPYVAIVCFSLSALGTALFALGAVDATAVAAVVLIGISLGAENDLLAYLAARYFGLRAFGSAYGLLFAAFLVGTALGPWVFGIAYERTGSYVGILTIGVALNIVAVLLTALLGPFPDWEKAEPESATDS